jgi:hypothetical protein
MQIPLHETADDPAVYRREHERARSARAVLELLVRATGAYEPRSYVPDEQAERARMLAHFAGLARDGRARWGARWQPSPLLLRALSRRNLVWADVEATLLDELDVDHAEACTCSACDRVRAHYERQAREREAAACGGISDFGRDVLGW